MPGLTARLTARGPLPTRRRAGRILPRRLRRVPRRASQLTLQRRDPLVLPSNPGRQLLDLLAQPLILRRELKQHPHDDIAALVIYRLGLDPLRTLGFDAARLCPPNQLNAYATKAELRSEIFDYIEIFYNRKRRHGTLGVVSPVDFETALSAPTGQDSPLRGSRSRPAV